MENQIQSTVLLLIQAYMPILSGTLAMAIMICALGMILGQNWWTPIMKLWVKYVLFGPFILFGWIFKEIVIGGLKGAFQGGKKKKKKKKRN